MNKLVLIPATALLLQGASAQDSGYVYPEMIPGLQQYDPNNYSNNFGIYIADSLIEPAQPVAAEGVTTFAQGLDPSLIGTFYVNGGSIYDPSGTHKWTVKENGLYNPIQTGVPNIRTGADLWLRDQSQITNSTSASGNSSYFRGNAEPVITLYLRHNLVGRFVSIDNVNNNSSSSAQTTITGTDDPLSSSWEGKAVDRTNAGQRTADNAITIYHQGRRNDRNMGSYTLNEGTYIGGKGFSGLYAEQANNFVIRGASFIGGGAVSAKDLVEDASFNGYAAMGAYFKNISSLDISNRTGVASDRFEGGMLGNQATVWSGNGVYGKSIDYSGGDGLAVWAQDTSATAAGEPKPNTVIKIQGGDFIGSRTANNSIRSIEFSVFDLISNTVDGSGGDGVALFDVGPVTITGGNFIGGDATSTLIGGPQSEAISHGGNGLWLNSGGTTAISGGNFTGGRSTSATSIPGGYWDAEALKEIAPTDDNSRANASGASGIVLLNNGTTTISGVTATGSRGSSARTKGPLTKASATGGSGIFAYNTAITINSGEFTGGQGGFATGKGICEASGGAGIFASGQSLVINGGTFRGGEGGMVNGNKTWGKAGVWVENANLTIAQVSNNTPTLVNGDVFINNLTGQSKTAAFSGGTITGDIYLFGRGTTALTVSTNAIYNGSFVQYAGTVNTTLTAPEQGKFFSDVYIGDATNNITGKLLSSKNASIVLGSANSRFNLATGLELAEGATVSAGYGQVKVTGDLILRDNAALGYSFDGLNNVGGLFAVTNGNIVASNANVKIVASGTSATPEGSKKIIERSGTGSVVLGSNNLIDIIDVDFGWLTRLTSAVTNNGIVVNYGYNSLTNSSLADLNSALLTMVDGVITNLGTSKFYALNADGASKGTSMLRYSLSQMPDVSESALQVSQKVSEQIAARGTEFRSMNGFASSQPRFGKKTEPQGAAGPDDEQNMQGWIRAYGAFGSRDADGNFESYDSGTWGTVIGVDKRFSNILVGLAGGYARTDLDADGTYEAEVNTYHGSVYSTIGGESVFVDLAATYARAQTEESNAADPQGSEFDSDVYSGYIGAGKSFDLGEKLALTPQASLLVTYYDQQSYDRTGIGGIGGTVDSYDTWSYLGSIGANLATQHQIDWLNRGMAMIPEVRAHWLHDFEAEADEFTYTIAGTPYVFGVRPREEDLLRLGFGFDVWSWKYQRTKFEVDYDALLADNYSEHIVSGKITVRF